MLGKYAYYTKWKTYFNSTNTGNPRLLNMHTCLYFVLILGYNFISPLLEHLRLQQVLTQTCEECDLVAG